MQALVDMMKINLSMHKIILRDLYSRHELFQGSVIPSLATNRLRPRVRAIQKTRSMSYRAKVLGRALLAARSDANSFWMLLSGNAEVAFPSTTATTTATTTLAAKLPTHDNDAVTATTSRADSTSNAAAAATNAATPTASQKRKARP